MFIGKWNKSVILTYIGLIVSILGIFICFNNSENSTNQAMACLIIAGICDLFDGHIARKCKRTEEEKKFGVQLDSLVDAINFIALPIAIFLNLNMNTWGYFIIIAMFAICGIARLAYFNIIVETNDKPIKYYTGLPVTYTALFVPAFYLLKYVLPLNIFNIIFALLICAIALLNIAKVKVIKPKGIAYVIFSVLAIAMIYLYLGVLNGI